VNSEQITGNRPKIGARTSEKQRKAADQVAMNKTITVKHDYTLLIPIFLFLVVLCSLVFVLLFTSCSSPSGS
jgi:hypothetical protein